MMELTVRTFSERFATEGTDGARDGAALDPECI